MTPEILKAYLEGRLMLLLGAGASYGSTDSKGDNLPMAEDLAKELAEMMGWEYNNEPLAQVYSAICKNDSAKLHGFFKRRFTNCKPSKALKTIASYLWPRIYTLNIDDCFERATFTSGEQQINVLQHDSPLEELDPMFKQNQLVKLNGSADMQHRGLVFSAQEYAAGTNKLPAWYRELGQNYSNYVFLFIGSKLNEPLFQHAIEEMRKTNSRNLQKGYALTPKATPIEKVHLESLNIEHIPCTIENFAEWLDKQFKTKPTAWDLAVARRPELKALSEGNKLTDAQKRAISCITVVSEDHLRKNIKDSTGKIRNFYKGYKPNWSDILDNVPANLHFVQSFSSRLIETGGKKKCFALVGQAGSGKTTAMMIAALNLSRETARPVYFLRDSVSDIKEIIMSLEELNDDVYYLFIDKVDTMRTAVHEALISKRIRNGCLVVSERINIWNQRVKSIFDVADITVCETEKITKGDCKEILVKLEAYGPFTYMQTLKPYVREKKLYEKSDRQLLIGLLEATTGQGFEQIIRDDFARMGNHANKKFFILVALANIHWVSLGSSMLGHALKNLGVEDDIKTLASQVEGIVIDQKGKYAARHPVYVRHIFEKVVDTDDLKECIIALLQAFADYKAPVIKHVSKAEGLVFKSIINHMFIKDLMRSDLQKVREIYEQFETVFRIDGLYWLQYGLALRNFSQHEDALEKLKTARQAYQSPMIEHAYAQQLMIMVREKITDWNLAQPILNEAIEIFESLDSSPDAFKEDTYPIVTLAEEHIDIVQKFKGIEKAREVANHYGARLLIAHKKYPSERLSKAATDVVSFATTGFWKNDAMAVGES